MTSCPSCQCEQLVGVQYGYCYSSTPTTYGHPDHYAGVSEYQCQSCHKRFGRWSGKELAEGETEPYLGVRRERPPRKEGP